MGIHEAASAGYTAAARTYERARPTYPDAAARVVGTALSGGGRRALDIGAGTGKWTRGLATLGLSLVAVEPVGAMRDLLRAAVPGAHVVAGTAEALPVASGSVDLATAAQAVHWFRLEQAVPEMCRVLQPGGHLAIVKNERDRDVPWVAAMDGLLEPHRGTAPSARQAPWRQVMADDPRLEQVAEEHIPNPEEYDADHLVARVASLSFVGALPEADRTELLAQVRHLTADLPDRFTMPYTTEVVLYRRRSSTPQETR